MPPNPITSPVGAQDEFVPKNPFLTYCPPAQAGAMRSEGPSSCIPTLGESTLSRITVIIFKNAEFVDLQGLKTTGTETLTS